jgi:hypothetical protein
MGLFNRFLHHRRYRIAFMKEKKEKKNITIRAQLFYDESEVI